eukprot:COSAG01_NODE_49811_length_368_cov_153.698885_1_plen_68_part_10
MCDRATLQHMESDLCTCNSQRIQQGSTLMALWTAAAGERPEIRISCGRRRVGDYPILFSMASLESETE